MWQVNGGNQLVMYESDYNINLPTVTTRCNSTYFAVARKSEVNLANAHIRIEGALYQFDANSGFERRARKELTKFWKSHLV